jgi:hypothetical protein
MTYSTSKSLARMQSKFSLVEIIRPHQKWITKLNYLFTVPVCHTTQNEAFEGKYESQVLPTSYYKHEDYYSCSKVLTSA